MPISYEDAVLAQIEIEDDLLQNPNVISVGVAEQLDNNGNKTGNYEVQVGILEKAYQHSLNSFAQIIPHEYVVYSPQDRGKKQVNIRLINADYIQALNAIPANLTDQPAETKRLRPSLCGYSISHHKTTAGTSSLVERKSKRPVGLLFAGNALHTYYNHLDVALAALSGGHTPASGTRKVNFEPSGPFRIIKRNQSTFSSNTLLFSKRLPVNSQNYATNLAVSLSRRLMPKF